MDWRLGIPFGLPVNASSNLKLVTQATPLSWLKHGLAGRNLSCNINETALVPFLDSTQGHPLRKIYLV